jgi:hypothetical protein
MPTTTGMKGGGFYDAHSKEQRAALDVFLPRLEQVVHALPDPTPTRGYWSLMDVGSSEGGNAIYAMNRIIAALRKNSPLPVRVFFDDLPTNDFNHLFANLFPAGGAAFEAADVFPAAIAGSAFRRLAPPRSLDVATTFNAVGFLERNPGSPLPHYILPMGPGPGAPRDGVSVTNAEREPFRLQAAEDLRRFYAARAEELVSGGKLLVQVFGRNEQHSTSYGIYDVLSDALLDQVEAGRLPKEVYERLVFPIYFRTLEELVAPIEADESLRTAFRTDHFEAREVPVPFNAALAATGDRSAWARSYTGFLRAFTESILAVAIPADVSKTDALDHIYRRVEKRLIEDPSRYEFHYISIATLLTRV